MRAGQQQADADDTDAYKELNLGLLTSMIRSKRWWCYAIMVRILDGFGSDFVSWAEACDCHGWLQPTRSRAEDGHEHAPEAVALKVARLDLHLPHGVGDGIDFGPCLLAGCRAPQ